MKEIGRHERLDPGVWPRLRFLLRPGPALVVAGFLLVITLVGALRIASLAENPSRTGSEEASPAAVSVQSARQSTKSQSEAQSATAKPKGFGLTAGTGPPEVGANVLTANGTRAEGESSSRTGQSSLVVHVSGAVNKEGVVTLPPGSRVTDAVEAAGGLAEGADLTAINLAALVTDGVQVHVPREGEGRRLPEGALITEGKSGSGSDSGSSDSGCVDLNSASEAELQLLDGVGPKLAARIVEHRSSNGGFASDAELQNVPGIGAVLSERISAGTCQ